jgi:hypothetical protein
LESAVGLLDSVEEDLKKRALQTGDECHRIISNGQLHFEKMLSLHLRGRNKQEESMVPSVYSPTIKMETISSSETSIETYLTTWIRISEPVVRTSPTRHQALLTMEQTMLP